MADDINKKISIDIEINTDGQQQINQYKTVFDGLRNTIDNLGKPLNDLSNNINSLDNSLSKIGGSSEQTTTKINTLTSSFASSIGVIKNITNVVKGWGIALSGGLAILITFAPEILNWLSSLLKGKEAMDKAKLSLDALNKGISSTDYAGAIRGLDQLKVKIHY